MTRIQYIDCSKWKKVIGIILWIGATFGVGFGAYFMYENSFYLPNSSCFKFKQFDSSNNSYYDNTACSGDSGALLAFLWTLILLANGGNAFMIYHTLNEHYRWIEFRCGKKPNGDGFE